MSPTRQHRPFCLYLLRTLLLPAVRAHWAGCVHARIHTTAVLQVEWDKGHALAHLLGALGLDGAEDVLPIYIGDDRCAAGRQLAWFAALSTHLAPLTGTLLRMMVRVMYK